MVEPLSIALGITSLILAVTSYHYYRKFRRYYNSMHPKPSPPSTQPTSKEIERERWLRIRSHILLRDRFRCVECGFYKHLEVHHIVPKAKGGTDDYNNLETLCQRCHDKKHGICRHANKKRKHTRRNQRKKLKRFINKHRKELSDPDRREELYKKWERGELNQPR
jgi:hypothetical protein